MPEDKILKELVKQIQEHLNANGAKLIVDGDMGQKTYDAINRREGKPVAPLKTAGTGWYLAHSLATLRAQINAAAPKRDKVADGTIGDAAHASRTSDHNPWVKDSHGRGVVTAIDITHDPADGVDCNKLAEVLKTDPRVKYIIWKGRIWNGSIAQSWREYKGANPHNHHIHISVSDDEKLFNSTKDWRIA